MEDSSGVVLLRRRYSELRRIAFFSLMAGFLLLPIVPIQFTSIITAIVWSVSGPLPGLAFLIGGTFFRPDSLPILSGLQNVVGRMFPTSGVAFAEVAAVAIMFVGNLAAAYLFRKLISNKIVSRIPSSRLIPR